MEKTIALTSIHFDQKYLPFLMHKEESDTYYVKLVGINDEQVTFEFQDGLKGNFIISTSDKEAINAFKNKGILTVNPETGDSIEYHYTEAPVKSPEQVASKKGCMTRRKSF